MFRHCRYISSANNRRMHGQVYSIEFVPRKAHKTNTNQVGGRAWRPRFLFLSLYHSLRFVPRFTHPISSFSFMKWAWAHNNNSNPLMTYGTNRWMDVKLAAGWRAHVCVCTRSKMDETRWLILTLKWAWRRFLIWLHWCALYCRLAYCTSRRMQCISTLRTNRQYSKWACLCKHSHFLWNSSALRNSCSWQFPVGRTKAITIHTNTFVGTWFCYERRPWWRL